MVPLMATHKYIFENKRTQDPVIFVLKMTAFCDDREAFVNPQKKFMQDKVRPLCNWASVYVFKSDYHKNKLEKLAEYLPIAPFKTGDWYFSIDDHNNLEYRSL